MLWAIAPPAVELGAHTPAVAATALIVVAPLPEEMLYRGQLVPVASAAVGPLGVLLASVGSALAYESQNIEREAAPVDNEPARSQG